MQVDLSNKIVVVTGGSRGLGREMMVAVVSCSAPFDWSLSVGIDLGQRLGATSSVVNNLLFEDFCWSAVKND